MKTHKYILLIILMTSLTFRMAYACDCENETPTVQKAYHKSKIIFTGKYKSAKIQHDHPRGTDEAYILTFEVSQIYKGKKFNKEVSIVSEMTSCGGDFIKGEEYLIFAYFDNETNLPTYHQCFMPFIKKNNADEAIAILKELKIK